MRRALSVADRLAQSGFEAEVIDLRTLRPLDVDTVVESVRKTNRVLIAEEGWATFGVGAELAARVGRACFDDLDAPPERVGGAEVPMPYSKPLELAALGSRTSWRRRPARSSRNAASSRPGSGQMAVEVPMPRLSDTMEQGTVARWVKHEGDRVVAGDVIAEIDTDKATMELTAYEDGMLIKILAVRASGRTSARRSR